MVGRLVLAGGKGRFRLVEDRLGPLEAVRAAVYAPEGLAPWRLCGRELCEAFSTSSALPGREGQTFRILPRRTRTG